MKPFFLLLICISFAVNGQNPNVAKSFDDEYFGYIKKSDRKSLFPSIIKKTVCEYNQWGYAEVNVNTEKLEKYRYVNPLKSYTDKKNQKNIFVNDFETKYPHAWGVIDSEGKFVVEPRFGYLYINREIADLKYIFLKSVATADYGKCFLLNRTNGTITALAEGFSPQKVQWISADYFFYDLYDQNNTRLRGVMRYDGTLLIDPVYSEVRLISFPAAILFLTTDPSGKKDLFTFSGNKAVNITEGKFQDISYIEGSKYFTVTSGGKSFMITSDGKVMENSGAVENEIKMQQQIDFENRVKNGDLTDIEFREYYNNQLVKRLGYLPSDLRDGYGVLSVWSPVADSYFSVNNGSFGLTGDSRSVKKSEYWAGCSSELAKEVPDLKERSSTSFIIVPYGSYEVTIRDMEFLSTETIATTTTYRAVVSAEKRCVQVRLE